MDEPKNRSLNPLNGLHLETNIPLSKFTTWRVGGAAQWLAEPKNIDEIQTLIAFCHKNQICS